jgi:hypothetical protein
MSDDHPAEPDWVTMFSPRAPDDSAEEERRRANAPSKCGTDETVDDEGAGNLGHPGWLDAAWAALPERSREILRRRLAGETLDEIGRALDLTRERVRQVQKTSESALVRAMEQRAPQLPSALHTELGDSPAVADPHIAALVQAHSATALGCLLKTLGLSHPHTWDGALSDYWTFRPSGLQQQLRRMVELAPLTYQEADQAASELGLPEDLDWQSILARSNSKLAAHNLGWIRPARATRDVAYLWLKLEGEPRPADEIAAQAGCSEHAARENMRRDPAFSQVRPEGTWALTDWRVPGSENRYSSAVDALVEVLRDLGPLPVDQLRVETQRRYPVSDWRVNQCLSSNLIGLNAAGLYDLAERGAVPVEDTEPKQPPNIKTSGDVVGIELEIDREILRGSGIPVNRWLTWHLGLRTAPSTRHFALPEGHGEVRVTRATSNAQISSLRAVTLELGLVEGCKLALLLNTSTDTASVRHICPHEACRARTATH